MKTVSSIPAKQYPEKSWTYQPPINPLQELSSYFPSCEWKVEHSTWSPSRSAKWKGAALWNSSLHKLLLDWTAILGAGLRRLPCKWHSILTQSCRTFLGKLLLILRWFYIIHQSIWSDLLCQFLCSWSQCRKVHFWEEKSVHLCINNYTVALHSG